MSSIAVAHPRFGACRRTLDAVNNWVTRLAGILLGGMVLAIAVSVSVRLLYTTLNIRLSAPWAEELARYFMVASVFLGGAVAAFQRRLIGVDAFVSVVPPHIARWVRAFAHLLTLLLALLLAWQAAALVEFGMRQWSPVMRMPMAYVYGAVLFGVLLMAANTALHVVGEVIGATEPETSEAEEALADVGKTEKTS